MVNLDWQRLPCPPAPHTYEFSVVTSSSPFLVEQAGDYYLGFEESARETLDFFNYKRITTKCTPVGSRFDPVPDQMATVAASFDTETGDANFVVALFGNTRPRFTRGDTNDDRSVDIGDVVHVLSHLFLGASLITPADAADVNDDGALDIADALTLLSYLFSRQHTQMLHSPYWETDLGRKGIDPTPDQL
jgi:hypothetical protein